jgi:hypothetical protein
LNPTPLPMKKPSRKGTASPTHSTTRMMISSSGPTRPMAPMVSGRVVAVHHDRRGMVVAVRSGVVAIMARVVAVGLIATRA